LLARALSEAELAKLKGQQGRAPVFTSSRAKDTGDSSSYAKLPEIISSGISFLPADTGQRKAITAFIWPIR